MRLFFGTQFAIRTAVVMTALFGAALVCQAQKDTATKKQTTTKKDTEKQETKKRRPDVIFVPTPQVVVDKMLELAKVKKGEVVYDLGCGDGRIVVTAAKKFGAKGKGFDIDPQRIKESLENVKKNKVEDKVEIIEADIFKLDLKEADVITLYLLPSLNVKLIPQLDKLKPGVRIVSHDFDMQGVKPDQEVTVEVEDDRERPVYLWTTPLKKEKETKASE
ncbi:MAG: methyltransferase domain-containing protein [Pirellulales bacterium]